MKHTCDFCKSTGPLALTGALCLCPSCLRALLRANPARPEYMWFVRAVRRSLFQGAA